MIAPAQLDYLHAKAAFEVASAAVAQQENVIDAALDSGEIDEAEQEARYAKMDYGPWHAAFEALKAAQKALLTWGQVQTRQQWDTHRHQFPGVTLDELDALYANKLLWVRERLVKIVLQLDMSA
jgi:hypothetical protein